MVDIEPYQYQKTTNIKEHNDIVAKINEIVDVINNANLDTVISKISELDTEIEGITGNLVSDISVIDGITTGKFKVRLDRKKAPSIDSNDYNLQKATSIELVQGSGPSMLKAQITLSDGTVLISDDFLFTTEAIGTDVYISSFVFKNGNVAGTISADIGLSNGTMLEANNFLVPTDPNVISNITDLQNRVTNIENTSVTDSRIDAIENELNNKADITNVDQEITFKTATVKSAVQFDGATGGVPSSTEYGIVGGNDEKHPFTVTMKKEAFGQMVRKPIGELALLDGSGNPKNFTAGEVWEEVDLNNWPTNWVNGDIVRVVLKISYSGSTTNHPTTTDIMLFISDSDIYPLYIPIAMWGSSKWASISRTYKAEYWNNKGSNVNCNLFEIQANGGSASITVDLINYTNYIYKMWRLKK